MDEYPSSLDEFQYVLMLKKADMSAHEYVSSQRIAGFDFTSVVSLIWGIVAQVSVLHGQGLVHLDLKLRNV